jgi:predicted xylose isomerase-like sugar epimerase
MPPQTQILIADKIKSWAFPILLTIVSVFLYHFYEQQNEMVNKLNDAMLNQVHQTGQQELIMFRINSIEKQIEDLKDRKIVAE